MYCKKCGSVLPSGSTKCENCGWEIAQNSNEPPVSPPVPEPIPAESALLTPIQNHPSSLKTKLSVWCWLSIASLCCGAFTLYKGFDKMFNYDSGDSYPYEYVNAYVGGDAYNYIINGTYATAFFVLTTMFVLAAIGLLIVHYVSQKEEK